MRLRAPDECSCWRSLLPERSALPDNLCRKPGRIPELQQVQAGSHCGGTGCPQPARYLVHIGQQASRSAALLWLVCNFALQWQFAGLILSCGAVAKLDHWTIPSPKKLDQCGITSPPVPADRCCGGLAGTPQGASLAAWLKQASWLFLARSCSWGCARYLCPQPARYLPANGSAPESADLRR